MKKGELANRAVDFTISYIDSLRSNHESYLGRIVFCFPRVRTNYDTGWVGGGASAIAAGVIARDPQSRTNQDVPLRYYNKGHSIPSVIVPLNGIEDVEYPRITKEHGTSVVGRMYRVSAIS